MHDILSRPPPPADTRRWYGPDPSQFGDLRLPAGAGPHPLVVYVHGGFWRAAYGLEHAGHACAALTEAGLATWNLEYRRLGQAGGGWPGTFLDVGQGADFARELAREYPLDLGRVLFAGHSAGGHLALWLAARPRIPAGDPLAAAAPLPARGALSLAGVADLRQGAALRLSSDVVLELLGGSPEEVPERYRSASPADLLPLGVPQALVHGTADDRVPFAISRDYAAAAAAAGDVVDLVPLPGVGHFEVIDPADPAWAHVVAAAHRLLR